METKEFKIAIPEGYEIDRENSTFECIKFRPITDPTYDDIAKSLFKDNLVYFINGHGCIVDSYSDVFDPNNASNPKQLARLIAMNQLLNVAEYYNRNREQEKFGYVMFRASDGTLCPSRMEQQNLTTQVPFFYSKEDTISVINNPNFKNLLDLVYL